MPFIWGPTSRLSGLRHTVPKKDEISSSWNEGARRSGLYSQDVQAPGLQQPASQTLTTAGLRVNFRLQRSLGLQELLPRLAPGPWRMIGRVNMHKVQSQFLIHIRIVRFRFNLGIVQCSNGKRLLRSLYPHSNMTWTIILPQCCKVCPIV